MGITVEKIWLDEREAAEYTSLSYQTIKNERLKGKITHRTYGRKIIYNRSDLDKFIEKETYLIKAVNERMKEVKHKNRK